MKHPVRLLLCSFAPLLLISCGKDDEGPADNRPVVHFQGSVTDADTGEGVNGLEIKYYSELGCSAILKEITTFTGSVGDFEFSYRKDIDSLIAEAERVDVDTSYVYHAINLNEPFYLPIRKIQGPREILVSRDGNLRPNREAVQIQVTKAGILEFEFEDTEIRYPNSIVEITIYLKSSPETPYLLFSYYSDAEAGDTGDLPDLTATVPADRPLFMKWVVKEGADFSNLDAFEVVGAGEEEILVQFKETKAVAAINI